MRLRVSLATMALSLVACTQPQPGAAQPARGDGRQGGVVDAAEQPAPAAAVSAPQAAANLAPESATTAPTLARLRPAAMAGSWYPAERDEVVAELSRMLRAASNAPAVSGPPLALVVPHAGWRFSGPVAAAAYRNLHRGDFRRVVVIAPSHRSAFGGFSVADVEAYQTPLGNVKLCGAAHSLRDGQLVRSVPGAHRQEHSIELQLPFLQHTLGSFCLVPILAGQTDPQMEQGLAAKLAELHDGQTLFVCSSDFIHYGPGFGYTPFGPSVREARPRILKLQQRAIGLLERQDAAGFRRLVDSTHATICGRRALSVLLELLSRIAPKARSKLLAHTASSDRPDARGDDGVWYVALAYVPSATAGK